MLVHHTGKDTAKGARGHSLLRAATDTEIEVKREEVPPSELGGGSPPRLGMTGWIVTPEQGLAENPKVIFRRPPARAA